LLNNTTRPTIGVGAIAKRELAPGELVERGAGGFQVRGEAVRISEHPRHVPVGVIGGACMRRRVEPGQLLTLDDVELPHSRAAEIALDTIQDAARPG
jgi:predicted homoserine dehydrogenase-like protein